MWRIPSASQGGHCFGEINSRTFQGLSSTLMTFFFKTIPPQLTQLLRHQVNVAASNTTVLIVLQWLHHFSHNGHFLPFWNSSTSRTSYAKLQNFFKHQIRFQGLSRALKKWEKFQDLSRTFNEEWPLGIWGPNSVSHSYVIRRATSVNENKFMT